MEYGRTRKTVRLESCLRGRRQKGKGEGEFGCAREKGKEGSIWRGVRNIEAA